MNWNLRYLEKEKVVQVTLEGILDNDQMIEVAQQHIKEAVKHKTTKVLIDAALVELNVDRADIFELTSSLYKKMGLDPNTQMAIIQTNNIDSIPLRDFYMLAMESQGGNVALFQNRKKALKWLREA